MKLTPIAAALAASLSSTVAFAAQPTPHNPLPVTPTVEMYFSGSTAADPLFKGFLAKNCDANTLDAYRADVSTGSTQYIYVCTSAAGFGGSGGPKGTIVVHKSGTSSSDGVTPVSAQSKIPFLSLADVQANYPANFPGVVVPANGQLSAYNYYTAPVGVVKPGANETVIPDVGFSDVEPILLASPTVVANLTATPDYQLIFAVPVTIAARNALQTAQGLPVGDDSAGGVQPTLTVSDLASIYQGKVTDLSAFDATGGTIYIGRRSSGSGTTKTFDKTFSGNACDAAAVPLVAATDSNGSADCTGTKGRVIQMGTSEDMEACLNNFQTAGLYAFGEISSDYEPAATDGWRIIKINGFSASALNTAEGQYPLWAEGSINTNTAHAPAGNKASILTTLESEVNNPVTLAAINSSLTPTLEGFQAGFLVLSSNANAINNYNFPLTAAQLATNPVALFSQNGSSCTRASSNSGSDPVGGPNGFTPQ